MNSGIAPLGWFVLAALHCQANDFKFKDWVQEETVAREEAKLLSDGVWFWSDNKNQRCVFTNVRVEKELPK